MDIDNSLWVRVTWDEFWAFRGERSANRGTGYPMVRIGSDRRAS